MPDQRRMAAAQTATLPLAAWIRAFDRARLTGKATLNAWTVRTRQELFGASGSPDGERVAPITPTTPVPGSGVPQRRAGGRVLLSRMVCQRRLMHRRFRTPDSAPVGVLALAVTRQLAFREGLGFRAHLHALTRALPGSATPDLASDICLRCPDLVLVDPARWSMLWADPEACWSERVFIIDGAFSAFVLLTSPLRAAAECWAQRLPLLDALRGRLPRALTLQAVAFHTAYRVAFRGPRSLRALFLNGNSVSTEALRAYLIGLPRCSDICEILHGTPSLEYEEYLGTVFRLAGYGGKHTFVPHVPQQPFGVYHARLSADRGFAVNLTLNRYRLAHDVEGSDHLIRVEEDIRSLCAGVSYRPLVVTFAGANSHDADYFSSETFAIEQALLLDVRRILTALAFPFVILYTPHPLHAWSSVSSKPFFQEHGIAIHPNTIFAWLVGDVCLALYSSALWDAEFAGMKAFAVLRETDDVYPQVLLRRLSHVGDNEPVLNALEAFLRTNGRPSMDDLRTRAAQRCQRFWGTAMPLIGGARDVAT